VSRWRFLNQKAYFFKNFHLVLTEFVTSKLFLKGRITTIRGRDFEITFLIEAVAWNTIVYVSILEHVWRREQMSRKKVMSIVLFIGAVIVLAGGGFSLFSGHNKTGLGLLVLGVIALVLGLVTFFSSTAEEREPYRGWIR
jgi:heme A synthase